MSVYFAAWRTQNSGPFRPILSQIYTLFGGTFTGIDNAVVYQNWQIWGMCANKRKSCNLDSVTAFWMRLTSQHLGRSGHASQLPREHPCINVSTTRPWIITSVYWNMLNDYRLLSVSMDLPQHIWSQRYISTVGNFSEWSGSCSRLFVWLG